MKTFAETEERKGTNGFLYCVYSEDGEPNRFFQEEFLQSYNSLKKVLPESRVALYTNINFTNNLGIDYILYDKEIDKRLICKAHGLLRSPFERTIFIDTDTVIHRKIINDVFEVLNEFSFACCYSGGETAGRVNGESFGCGTIFPDLNTGVLGSNKSEKALGMIREWIKHFDQCKKENIPQAQNDQLAFMYIFLNNKREFHILPPYLNWRWAISSDYHRQATISHDRFASGGLLSHRQPVATTKAIAARYLVNIGFPEEAVQKFLTKSDAALQFEKNMQSGKRIFGPEPQPWETNNE